MRLIQIDEDICINPEEICVVFKGQSGNTVIRTKGEGDIMIMKKTVAQVVAIINKQLEPEEYP